MAIYWIISYSLLACCIFELAAINQLQDTRVKRFTTYLLFVGAMVLICFGGSRGLGSGMDDSQYLDFFHDFSAQLQVNTYSAITDTYRYEKLFMLLAWVFSLVTKESYYFLFFICAIAVSTNVYCYKKYSPLLLCSLCLYSTHLFINKDMNQIRFGLSSAFAIAFICSMATRKHILAAVFLVLSTQSHSTGYTVILVMPFIFMRERKYLPLVIVFASIPLGIIGGKKLFLDSLGIVPGLGERAEGYSGTDFDTASPVFGLANLKNIFFIGAFTLYYFRNGIKKEDRLVYILLIAYSVGAAVRITFSDFSIFGGRVGNLFLHAEPILFSFLLLRIRHLLINIVLLGGIATYYLAYNTILSAQSITGYSVSPLFKLFG
ncbi:EpsG family protein [Pantoea sp. MBD-2R]|uniref:EpsG family protein n=1 Tax=unclassified Pantoea TaxID=2630326 RepID=UPI0011BE4B36|nr:EpsG family protein [Pantoea sp. CCBC3-3-1]